jgi:hypothetical protein
MIVVKMSDHDVVLCGRIDSESGESVFGRGYELATASRGGFRAKASVDYEHLSIRRPCEPNEKIQRT